MTQIQLNSYGVTFNMTVMDGISVMNLSGYTTILKLKKPDNTVVTKSPSFITDGVDGKIKYTLIQGDIDQIGKWQLQVILSNISNQYPSTIENFKVVANL